MGIFALLSFLPTEEQGREGRLAGGGLGRRLGAQGRLWTEGKERGRREDPIPAVAWDGVVRGGPATRVGGGERRRPWWHRCGARWRPRGRGKVRVAQEGPIPTLARAGAWREDGATRAGDGGHGGSGWWRRKAGEEGHGGGMARGVGCGARGPLYSRGKAVGRAERVGWPAGQLAAINGVRSGASSEAGWDVSSSGVQQRGGASDEAATR